MSIIYIYLCRRRDGYGVKELSFERVECSELNSLPNPPHGVKVKLQIMQAVQRGGAHLSGQEQVP